MKKLITTLLVLILFMDTGYSQSTDELEVIYVANEGFLISSGDQKIIIDAGIFWHVPGNTGDDQVETVFEHEGFPCGIFIAKIFVRH